MYISRLEADLAEDGTDARTLYYLGVHYGIKVGNPNNPSDNPADDPDDNPDDNRVCRAITQVSLLKARLDGSAKLKPDSVTKLSTQIKVEYNTLFWLI